jgi:hypothetical protein
MRFEAFRRYAVLSSGHIQVLEECSTLQSARAFVVPENERGGVAAAPDAVRFFRSS